MKETPSIVQETVSGFLAKLEAAENSRCEVKKTNFAGSPTFLGNTCGSVVDCIVIPTRRHPFEVLIKTLLKPFN